MKLCEHPANARGFGGCPLPAGHEGKHLYWHDAPGDNDVVIVHDEDSQAVAVLHLVDPTTDTLAEALEP